MVDVDPHERRSGIPERLADRGVALRPRVLRCADYVVGDRVAIVRKHDGDLAPWQPLARFERALREATARYPVVVLVLERRLGAVADDQRRSALARAARHGVAVLEARDRDDAAAWIARVAEQESRSPSDGWGVGAVRKPAELDLAAERLLATLPGVSWVGARRLLEHFGAVRAIAAADAQELQNVRGVGPKRAAAIAEVLSHRYAALDQDRRFARAAG